MRKGMEFMCSVTCSWAEVNTGGNRISWLATSVTSSFMMETQTIKLFKRP